MHKIIKISLALFLISQQASIAKIQICEIKYWGNSSDRKDIKRMLNRRKIGRKQIRCNKIGTEYDKSNRPIKEQPIFACCRDPIGDENNI